MQLLVRENNYKGTCRSALIHVAELPGWRYSRESQSELGTEGSRAMNLSFRSLTASRQMCTRLS